MGAALALAERGRGRTAPNPPVGCVIAATDGKGRSHVIGRGWTQPGGRPHAEAIALEQAGARARGATAYVTLEPCAHVSARGPACADLLLKAGIARLVCAMTDPDPRTAGKGFARLAEAGVAITDGVRSAEAASVMAGFLTRQRHGRPHVTLKIATSLDGCIALGDGTSRWITGEAARAHAHLERARAELILVGRGTLTADQPRLNVRLPGLEDRAPRPAVLSTTAQTPAGWVRLASPADIATLEEIDHVLIEGGSSAAAAFLKADLVDRLLVYRAPIIIGRGLPSLGDIGLADLPAAHGRWHIIDQRKLGSDLLEVYERDRG